MPLTNHPRTFIITHQASYTMWTIGVTLAVLCSLFNSVAINLQKLSLNRHPEKPVLKQPLWMLGFVLLLSGTFLDFIAFGLAPQSLLAPLAALTLVWNMLITPIFLKERRANAPAPHSSCTRRPPADQ